MRKQRREAAPTEHRRLAAGLIALAAIHNAAGGTPRGGTVTAASVLAGTSRRAFVAPVDVRLPKRDENDQAVETVVQPDVLVVCDPSQLDRRGVRGAPDATPLAVDRWLFFVPHATTSACTGALWPCAAAWARARSHHARTMLHTVYERLTRRLLKGSERQDGARPVSLVPYGSTARRVV